MEKQIRKNTFETNSSLIHSIAISENNSNDHIIKDIKNYLNEHNKIPIFSIKLESGWGFVVLDELKGELDWDEFYFSNDGKFIIDCYGYNPYNQVDDDQI